MINCNVDIDFDGMLFNSGYLILRFVSKGKVVGVKFKLL